MSIKKQHFHFIGISGIGMSGIAKVLLQQGYQVSGCDSGADPKHTQELLSLGCKISQQHLSDLCTDPTVSAIVYSSAIKKTHPELIHAQKHNIPTMLRAEMLAKLMENQQAIAVSGSHGKTTTTSLITHILLKAGQEPSFVVGGHINSLNSNASYNKGKLFVAEADESDRSLLKLPKEVAVITSINVEHLETYKDFQDIKETFISFANTIPSHGTNILCLDDSGIKEILPEIKANYTTYGTDKQADIQAQDITLDMNGSTFNIYQKSSNTVLGKIILPEAGFHYVLNATGAIATALHLNVPFNKIQSALKDFTGVDRRFTYKGVSKAQHAHVFDDYGHHPKEIEYSLLTARSKAKNNLVVVFQPHRYSRTQHLWNDFVKTFALAKANTLIITDIYPASEQPIDNISGKDLIDTIKKQNPDLNALYCPIDENLESLSKILDSTLKKDDLLLLQGAGKVHKIAKRLI